MPADAVLHEIFGMVPRPEDAQECHRHDAAMAFLRRILEQCGAGSVIELWWHVTVPDNDLDFALAPEDRADRDGIRKVAWRHLRMARWAPQAEQVG